MITQTEDARFFVVVLTCGALGNKSDPINLVFKHLFSHQNHTQQTLKCDPAVQHTE